MYNIFHLYICLKLGCTLCWQILLRTISWAPGWLTAFVNILRTTSLQSPVSCQQPAAVFSSVFAPVFPFSSAASWRRCQYFLPQLQSEADSFWRLITKLWFGFVSDYLRFAKSPKNTFWQNFSPQWRLESAFRRHQQLSSEGDNSRSPPVGWRRREQSTATKCYHRGREVNGLWRDRQCFWVWVV